MEPLAEFTRTRELALTALRRGDTPSARRHLWKLSAALHRLADSSLGESRLLRSRQAREMAAAARLLGHRPGRGRGTSSRRRGDDEVVTEAPDRYRVAERPRERLDDVAGLEHAKEAVRLRLVYPFQHPEEADRFRVRRGGGILLVGPPGTGKTLLARAVAGELDAAFFTVKPSEVLSKWVGEAEQNVARLFQAARSQERSVVFIDEIDALMPRRGETTSPVMSRLVPQILTELEGFERRGGTLLFLGATNEPWLLDPAVLRPGRFDEVIHVPLPDRAARARVLEIHLRGRPLQARLDFEAAAAELEGLSGADIRAVCDRAAAEAFLESVTTGAACEIRQAALTRIAAGTRPSVSRATVERYEHYAGGGTAGAFHQEACGAEDSASG